MFVDGAVPEEKYLQSNKAPPARDQKKLAESIERKVFSETLTVGYRLKTAA